MVQKFMSIKKGTATYLCFPSSRFIQSPFWLKNNKNVYRMCCFCTDKKKNFFLIYKEIQKGAVAKSYMRKGLLIYEEMRKYFPTEIFSYLINFFKGPSQEIPIILDILFEHILICTNSSK